MHQRMQAQLAEKQARDASESSEKEEKVDLRNRVVKPKIEAWTQGKKVITLYMYTYTCIHTHIHVHVSCIPMCIMYNKIAINYAYNRHMHANQDLRTQVVKYRIKAWTQETVVVTVFCHTHKL